jgi:hypothetical protein
MKKVRFIGAAAIVLCLAARVVAADASVAPANAVSRQVLQTFPAGPYQYEVALDDCAQPARKDAKCTFSVRLLGNEGKVVDRAEFAQTACGPGKPIEPTPALTTDHQAKAWGTSDEHCEVDLSAQTVALGPETVALLVTQLQGFEYRYRSHVLYLPKVAQDGPKLYTAWHVDEDSDATHWSTAIAVKGKGKSGGQDVAFIDAARAPSGVVKKLSAERLHVDATSGRLTRSRLPDATASLFVLQAGRFRSLKAIDKARGRCSRDLVMLRATVFPRLKVPAFFFGAVFLNREDAEASAAAFDACSETTRPS